MGNQHTIYLTPQERADIDRLLSIKAQLGDQRVIGQQRRPSISALITALVNDELKRLNAAPQKLGD